MAKVFTLQKHQEHTRYLEMLKTEFIHKLSNPSPFSTSGIEEYDKIKTIGHGAYGEVFLVRHKMTFVYHALKAVDKSVVVERNHVKHVVLEKQILQAIQFPFVINLDSAFKDNWYVFLVLPFVAGGELFTYIQRYGNFSDILTKFYASQVVLALEYLHHCGIVHRDLKPENILLDSNGYLKLCDFGFCKVLSKKTYTLCGTPEYIAPEIILSKGYSFPVDWWALGILIFEMETGNPPFFSSEPSKLYEKVLEGNFKCPDNMKAECRALIKGLLQVEPTKRIGALKGGVFDIKSHAWFKDICFSSILHQRVEAPFVPICTDPGDTNNFPEIEQIKLKTTMKPYYEKEFENF